MKQAITPIVAAVAATLALNTTGNSGTAPAGKLAVPMAEVDQFGALTFGAKSSDDIQSGYADLITGLHRTGNSALFLNVRGTFDDRNQQLFSAGLGFRYLFEDPGIIIGANIYYDRTDSGYGNGINQLGLGVEMLSKWFDARFNYYSPEDDRHLVSTFKRQTVANKFGPLALQGNQFVRPVRTTTTTTTFGIFEEGLQGWNAEAGVLVPGLDKWMELRIFAGGYSYEDPKGGDIAGFKARAEARVTEGITFDLEYWEDEELVGGNWVGGVRVSLPFDIGNLFTGRNPFAGAGDVFRPIGQNTLRDRMDEMVIRSHRVQTGLSNPEPTNKTVTTTNKVLTTGRDVMPPITAPPATGGGEAESPEQSESPSEESSDFQGEGQEFPR